MIIANGIDIIDIRRIEKIILKYNFKFKERCFHKEEIIRSENKDRSIQSYAKKFAAKEACAKALGTGFAKGISWKDIEIKNNINGKPKIKLHNKALKLINKLYNKNNYSIELSLSDEKNYAIANVLIYEKKTK